MDLAAFDPNVIIGPRRTVYLVHRADVPGDRSTSTPPAPRTATTGRCRPNSANASSTACVTSTRRRCAPRFDRDGVHRRWRERRPRHDLRHHAAKALQVLPQPRRTAAHVRAGSSAADTSAGQDGPRISRGRELRSSLNRLLACCGRTHNRPEDQPRGWCGCRRPHQPGAQRDRR